MKIFGRDTEMALGSDAMEVATEGYNLLKVSGRNQGLEGLRKELSAPVEETPAPADRHAGAGGRQRNM